MSDVSDGNFETGESVAAIEGSDSEKRERIIFSGIEVGTSLAIEIPGSQGRFSSKLLGFEPDQFLIIKLPTSPGIRQWLAPGGDIVIRYISNGSIIGLMSSIIQVHYEPVGVAFLAFPLSAERINLRKHKRVQCFFPTLASIKGFEFRGAILDMSAGGCRFLADESQGGLKRLAAVEKGDEIALCIETFGSDSIGGEIAKLEFEGGLYTLGIKLITIPAVLRVKIEEILSMADRVQF